MKENKELAKDFGTTVTPLLENEAGRKAVAELIVNYVSNQIEQQDLSELVLDKQTIQLGQIYEWIHRSKLKAYWHEPGSYAPRTQMTQRSFRIPTKMISAHPEYELGQLAAGRYGTVADQIAAAKDAILGEINAMVFNTLKGSITSAKQNYSAVTLVSGSGSAATNVAAFKTALDTAIRWCKDHPGGVRAIIGRAPILDYIMDFDNTKNNVFSPSIVDTIMRDGVIGQYRGVPIIALPQWEDQFGKPTIPSNEVLVVGKGVGKVIFEDTMTQLNDIDINEGIWHVKISVRVGAGVLFPENMYRIAIS